MRDIQPVKISIHPYFLEFKRPFALAHGTRKGTQLAFVRITHEGYSAYGEASLPPYLKETYDSVDKWVSGQTEAIQDVLKSNPFDRLSDIPFSSKHPAASAALQSAILNWYVTANGVRLSDHFESGGSCPSLTLTITKNDFDSLKEVLETAKDFNLLKLKLTGAYDDLEFVEAIHKKTDLPFCIDLNQGCSNKEKAISLINSLERYQCLLIEQPLKAEDHEGHYWLKQRIQKPIIADESIRSFEDLKQFHEAYSGVNVKLMKCGGLFQAKQMLEFKASNQKESSFLKILGCMSESSLGVATAAVLASEVSIADLDAPYLNINDPFSGFQIVNQRIELEEPIRLKKGISL